MSEEEIKEIFSNLKEYIQNKIDSGEHKIYYNDLDWDVKCIDCITAIDNILELYNKQQEEIENLKNRIANQDKEIKLMKSININEEIERDYISKDKINNKIKELEKEKDLYFEKQVIQGKIDLLKELLEE